jgi:hypothetical protein
MTKGRAEPPGKEVAEQELFYPAAALAGRAILSFVISTGAQRSGEISVWMLPHGDVCHPVLRIHAAGAFTSFAPALRAHMTSANLATG